MPKLHLKRTPEEEAARRQRKQEKKEARRKRRHHHYDDTERDTCSAHSRKRRRCTTEDPLESERNGPQPAGSSTSYSGHNRHKPDQDELRAEMEDMRFREKMFDAFADDERLDSLEARFNDFAHVPDRWKTSSSSKTKINIYEDEWLKLDPQAMDDEEYTEWIRMGMYRKTHANEYAEQQRQKAAQASRRAEEKTRREETARLAKAAEEERKARKRERDARRWVYARDVYHTKWNPDNARVDEFGFSDIPWPVLQAHREKDRSKHSSLDVVAVTVDELTVEAISAFLLPGGVPEGERSRKEVLRETFLRFHPDKFEGRFMKNVREREQEEVREGIGRVVRALNTLMGE
ncbi:hypothetical protein AN958_08799 [Leucoagaricus sp. SymC.cos]|nr:hypothetical protein AN958_08799 [Leucoagaricus sp. SymC.cos]